VATKTKARRSEQASDIRASRPYILAPRPLLSLTRRLASILTLVILDLAGLAAGLYLARLARELWHGQHQGLWEPIWQSVGRDWLPFLALLTVLVFWRAHLYSSRERRGGPGQVFSSLVVVGLFAFLYVLGTGHKEYTTFGIFPASVVTAGVAITVLRAGYDVSTRGLLRAARVRRRAILVGGGEALGRLRLGLGRGRAGIEYEFLGVLGAHEDETDLRALGPVSRLPKILERERVDEIIVADDFKEQELLELSEYAHRRGLRVRVAPRTSELMTKQGEYVPGHGIPLFEIRPPMLIGTDWLIKRSFDLVLSSIVLVAGLPIWAAIAAVVKLSSPGPVFYHDRRVGVGEQEFDMLKFRTMFVDAAERQAELEAQNEAPGALFKIKDDPRVTGPGRFLRRFSLDEIPQLWNVLSGEMSLVGPRPLPLRDYLQLEDWHRKRYLVLPGATGLWQVSGRTDLDFDDLVRLDFYYLENWSIWLDITVIAKTIPAVLMGRGAY
jgi:exopolysaccharide biosynthesis polyprenyl glycosylphosphotransferase